MSGAWGIFVDGISKRANGQFWRAIIEESCIFIDNFSVVPEIHSQFERLHFRWIAKSMDIMLPALFLSSMPPI